ncbi:hypothetical protein BpHYR1_028380 [Brachionus plicatilis]|uniref:Uncharacterized protein n=1 Tax=Brachionus plicatilis TaxID=10195 RepID=A0A3M7QQQ5_BRAPC|nr:hypothetical protein BpHYR1_028380 [Brachionus plicatilis]
MTKNYKYREELEFWSFKYNPTVPDLILINIIDEYCQVYKTFGDAAKIQIPECKKKKEKKEKKISKSKNLKKFSFKKMNHLNSCPIELRKD